MSSLCPERPPTPLARRPSTTCTVRLRPSVCTGLLAATVSALVLAGGLVANRAEAANWLFMPEFEAGVGFDDNIGLRESGGRDTYRGTTSLGLVAEQYAEDRQLRLRGVAGYSVYDGDREAPDDGDFQRLQGQTVFRGDRTTWRFNGEARRDKSVVTTLQVIDLTDPDDSIDPGSEIDRVERDETVTQRRVFLTPSVDHELTSRLSVGASYAGRYIGYEGSTVPTDRESLNHEVELRAGYALTERSTVGTAAYAARFRPRSSNLDLDTYGLSLTYGYAFTERSGFDISGGVRRTEPASNADELDRSTGFIGQLRMFTRGDDWRGAVRMERRLLPSARGVLKETDQLIVTGTREFSPRWEGALRMRAFTARTPGRPSSAGDPRHYGSVSPGLTYRLTPEWSLTGEYEFRALKRVEGDGEGTANVVFLSVQYAPARAVRAF